MAKGVWGIDVSKYSLKAVRLEQRGEQVVLTHVTVIPYEGVKTGETQNIDDQIKSAFQELKTSHRVGSERLVLSLPTHSFFNRLIKLPPVDDEKIPEIVKYEAQSQIPFLIDEVLWDFKLIERTYEPGEEKEVILFAVKRDIVEQFLANLADLRLNIDAVQFAPVALFNFLSREQEMTGALVVLDMGGENCDLMVIDGAKFWTRNLPITGSSLTAELQKALNISFAEAEKLKLRAGQTQQTQKVFNAIQPKLRDLVGEIHRSTGYYKSISKTIKFDKIILLGNATKMLNFQKFISQSLQIPAVRIQKLNTLTPAPTVDHDALNNNLGSLGGAIGLALQGLGQAGIRVNLLPPVYLEKKEARKRLPYVWGSIAALFLLMGLMYYRANGDVARLKQVYENAKLEDAKLKQLNADHMASQQMDDIKRALAAVTSITTEHDLILKVLDEINPNIPDTANPNPLWILDWRFEIQERKTEPSPGAGSASPAPAAGGQPPRKPYLIHRDLSVSIEVGVPRTSEVAKTAEWIAGRLLNPVTDEKNFIPKDPPPRKSAIGRFRLKKDSGWKVESLNKDVETLLPRELQLQKDSDAEKRYSLYLVTLKIPVGERLRIPPTVESAKQP